MDDEVIMDTDGQLRAWLTPAQREIAEQYQNRTAQADIYGDGFEVSVRIIATRQVFGRHEALCQPIHGAGAHWFKLTSITLDPQ
jgi:hypothetical protein